MIVEYRREHEGPVAELNRRVGGAPFQPRAGSTFVDLEGEVVRGGYATLRRRFVVGSDELDVHQLERPAFDAEPIGKKLVEDAQRRFPLLLALVEGGRADPLPRTLEAMGWRLDDLHFFFRVSRPQRFLRQVAFLRTTPARRALLDVLAVTGVGLAILPLHGLLDRLVWARGARSEAVAAFGNWADRVWEKGHPAFSLVSRRDRQRLAARYGEDGYVRLRVDRGGETIGWAVLIDAQLEGDQRFGDLRVGSLVDGFAVPGEERVVVHEATRFLRKRGVDLVISHQSGPKWCAAMLENGWLEGPPSQTLCMSRRLATRVGTGALHVTRGDGEAAVGG